MAHVGGWLCGRSVKTLECRNCQCGKSTKSQTWQYAQWLTGYQRRRGESIEDDAGEGVLGSKDVICWGALA